jgi:Domain of unknown function (DUF4304)
MGFKGSGQSFTLPSKTHWVLLGFQKSMTSNAKAVRFTVNLTAASKQAWSRTARSLLPGGAPRREHLLRRLRMAAANRPVAPRRTGHVVDGRDARLGRIGEGGGAERDSHLRPARDRAAVGRAPSRGLKRTGCTFPKSDWRRKGSEWLAMLIGNPPGREDYFRRAPGPRLAATSNHPAVPWRVRVRSRAVDRGRPWRSNRPADEAAKAWNHR